MIFSRSSRAPLGSSPSCIASEHFISEMVRASSEEERSSASRVTNSAMGATLSRARRFRSEAMAEGDSRSDGREEKSGTSAHLTLGAKKTLGVGKGGGITERLYMFEFHFTCNR